MPRRHHHHHPPTGITPIGVTRRNHHMGSVLPGFVGHRHVHPHVNSVHYHPHYLKLHIVFIIIAVVMVVAIGIGSIVWWVVSTKNTSDMNWTERTTGRKEQEEELTDQVM